MPRRATGWVFAALLALLVSGLALSTRWRSSPASQSASQLKRATPPDAGLSLAAQVARQPRSPDKHVQQGPCLPEAEQVCHQGDVWLVDSCGKLEEKLEECETRFCRDDACDEPASEPCREPMEGRCDGDVVRACVAGRVVSVDCAAQGLRCIMGDEGAECAPLVPFAERCRGEAARCDGDTLIVCDQGRSQRTDCQTRRSKCLQLPGKAPSCVQLRPFDLMSAGDCGPCGCMSKSSGKETECDGRDDDGNGLVDEQLACGPVPIVAFIATDGSGQSSHAREDVENEIAAANRAFGEDGLQQGLSFVLADLFFIADASLLDLEPSEFGRLIDDPRVHPTRGEFYVPVLFTDTLSAAGGAPRIGVSTLPNGTCGGVQEGKGPDVGVVAVAKGRSPTTLIHELGHFLGLCHTHDKQQSPLSAGRDANGMLVACNENCRGDGDGVCDTPFDPGPDACAFDLTCQSSCRVSAVPDTANLMSYYTPCRQHFSEQQMALMQHSLALRRGWHRCLSGECSCSLGGDECPVGMSCLPVSLRGGERAARCMLAGPLAPGSDCSEAAQCGAGAVCLSDAKSHVQRCVRACTASSAGCDCSPAREGLSICIQDLTM